MWGYFDYQCEAQAVVEERLRQRAECEADMSGEFIEDRYLGDGVYASFDGYHIILDLRGQDIIPNLTRIALEPDVYAQLVQFHGDIQRQIAATIKAPKDCESC